MSTHLDSCKHHPSTTHSTQRDTTRQRSYESSSTTYMQPGQGVACRSLGHTGRGSVPGSTDDPRDMPHTWSSPSGVGHSETRRRERCPASKQRLDGCDITPPSTTTAERNPPVLVSMRTATCMRRFTFIQATLSTSPYPWALFCRHCFRKSHLVRSRGTGERVARLTEPAPGTR